MRVNGRIGAEISAVTASIAGAAGPFAAQKIPHFMGFFAVARRLLTFWLQN
jgi:hypothetical protein